MSAIKSPTTRTRRGRVLVVDSAELSSRLAKALPFAVEHADDLFEALGRIAHTTARDPMLAVIVSAREVRRRPAAAAESIRRLDPAVQLVLVGNDDDDAGSEEAINAGFDQAVLGEKPDRLIIDILNDPDGCTGVIRPEPPVVETGSTLRERAEQPAPKPTSPPAPEQPKAHPLGDVDLVATVLDDPNRLPALAMLLLKQESGFEDAVLHESQPIEPVGCAVEVRDDERTFGWLTASTSPEKLAPWARWLARWCRLAADHAVLREKAFRDPLTGAYNRRFVDESLPKMLAEARDRRRAVAIMVFDIDDLKKYNDQFGHDAGDEVLCETVKLLQSVVRRGDCVCRMGGDEFAVIFADPEGPRTRGAAAVETVEQIVERFRDQVCKLKLSNLGPHAPGPVSVSAGLATFPWDAHDATSLLKSADQRAIESKRKGKNAVTLGPTGWECKESPETGG